MNFQWVASPINDMYADTVLTAVLQAESVDNVPKAVSTTSSKLDRMHFKECMIEMLQDMFGEDSVPKIFKGEKLHVTVDGKKADIDLESLVLFLTKVFNFYFNKHYIFRLSVAKKMTYSSKLYKLQSASCISL
jgi:Pre-mRNA 3'-end-processing endonuclease polyadenylation factor C-term